MRPVYAQRQRLAADLLPALEAFAATFADDVLEGGAQGTLVDALDLLAFWANTRRSGAAAEQASLFDALAVTAAEGTGDA